MLRDGFEHGGMVVEADRAEAGNVIRARRSRLYSHRIGLRGVELLDQRSGRIDKRHGVATAEEQVANKSASDLTGTEDEGAQAWPTASSHRCRNAASCLRR